MKTNEINFEQIKNETITLVAERLGINANTITIDSDMEKDLGADSLDTVELLMDIEQKFGVHIGDNEASGIHTIGEAVQHIYDTLSEEN